MSTGISGTNAPNPAALIAAVVASFDFTLPGADQSLGRDLATLTAVEIAARSNAGLDPDGVDFKANEKKYAAYKLKRYSVDRPGELGGQMLSLASLKGEVAVSADSVEMTYGTGELPPKESRTGVPLKPWELKATDREKAEYFTDSGRRFYEFDNAIADKLQALAFDHLTKVFESLGF